MFSTQYGGARESALSRKFYSSPPTYQSGGIVLVQSGASLGSWIGKSVRFLIPYLEPILNSLTNEALSSSKNVINQVSQDPSNWRGVLKSQAESSLSNLSSQARDGILNKINQLQTQRGSGIGKSRKRRTKSRLRLTAVARKSSSTKRKRRSVKLSVSTRKRKSSSKKRKSSRVLF